MSLQRGEHGVVVTVYMSRKQRDALRALSAATRVPVSAYIRDGVDAVVSRAKDPDPDPEE